MKNLLVFNGAISIAAASAHKLFNTMAMHLKIIPTLDHVFDLVFIDAEKTEYPAYFESVLANTRSGSIILSDNVLWSGKVIEPLEEKDKTTEILLDYNERLRNDHRLETVLLPIRDGLTLCRVK